MMDNIIIIGIIIVVWNFTGAILHVFFNCKYLENKKYNSNRGKFLLILLSPILFFILSIGYYYECFLDWFLKVKDDN